MGRRGPKPDPAAVKIAKGNPGRRRVGADPKAEEQSREIKVAPPSWLKDDGLKVWRRLAPGVEKLRLLTAVDAETFARYCRNFARWLDANKAVDELGMAYDTETGYERIRVAMAVSIRLEPVLERAEDRFGLNPAERQRIFAQRAAVPAGDLFGQPSKAPADAAPKPAPKPEGPESPVGLLN